MFPRFRLFPLNTKLRWLPSQLSFLLILALVWGFTGCQNTPQQPTTPAPTSTLPSSTRTPPPTATAPPPSPTPAPTSSSGLPPLSFHEALPWNPPLPILHGVTDDAPTLQHVLQTLLAYEQEIWIAAWPPNFPADLPLPTQGWVALATYNHYGTQASWSLLLEAPSDPDSWQQAFEATLKQVQWQKAPRQALPSAGDSWCSPQRKWMVTFFADSLQEEHAIIRLTYQNNAAESYACQQNTSAVMKPPSNIPTLTPPPGTTPLNGEESGGDTENWLTHFRLRSPDGIQPLLTAFTRQLTQQGWQILSSASGNLQQGETAFIRVRQEGAEWPEANLLLFGENPLYDVWLWNGKVPKKPSPMPPPDHLPVLHGNTDNPVALRRALALSQWSPWNSATQPTQIWVRSAPSPWPLQILPQPPQAQWESVIHQTYTDENENWTFRFYISGSEEETQTMLEDLLAQTEWQRLSPNRIPDIELQWGFQPAPPEDNLLAHTFCHNGDASLIAEYEPAGENRVAVTWRLNAGPGLCHQMRTTQRDTYPLSVAPTLTLTLATDDTISLGGLSPRDNDFARGYVTYALWWSEHTLEEQRSRFAEQCVTQGWQILGEGSVGNALTWLQSTQTDSNNITWRASLIILEFSDQYDYGVLVIEPAQP